MSNLGYINDSFLAGAKLIKFTGGQRGMILKNCAYIITQNKNREILRNQDILIEGSTITAMGKNLKGNDAIDCSKKAVMPGLINTHTHLGMHSLKGTADEGELFEWLANIKEKESKTVQR